MNQSGIGKLERVPLREVWKHEARDFTQWLENNSDALSDVLGITLINLEREQAAGSFSVDLVAEREGGGKVIIENQLERSNHDHLGKVITYLTQLNAQVAVWIVAEARAEHVAALSWLNANSSGRFYLLEVEAVRIGSSPAAPLLTLIVGPSEEKAEIAKSNTDFAERYDLRERWWKQLLALPEAKLHTHISPPSKGWITTSSGTRGLSYTYVVLKDENTVELYIDRGKDAGVENKAMFDQLLSRKKDIELDFGDALGWERLDAKRACRIRFSLPGGYRSPVEQWGPIQDIAVQAMNRLERALRPHLKTLMIGI